MKNITLIEFEEKTSEFISVVESGEILKIIRNGEPIIKVSPIKSKSKKIPSWKKKGLRLVLKPEAGLTEAIIQERQ